MTIGMHFRRRRSFFQAKIEKIIESQIRIENPMQRFLSKMVKLMTGKWIEFIFCFL